MKGTINFRFSVIKLLQFDLANCGFTFFIQSDYTKDERDKEIKKITAKLRHLGTNKNVSWYDSAFF